MGNVRWIKSHKITGIMAIALGLSILSGAILPATPTLAQSITFFPPAGFPGTVITVTGRELQPYAGKIFNIFFSNEIKKTIVIPASGNFTEYINVPGYVVAGAAYSLSVRDEYGGSLASASFYVAKSRLETDPFEGKIGNWIKVTGRDFDAGRAINLYVSSRQAFVNNNMVNIYEHIGRVNINADGVFEVPFGFAIPSALTSSTAKEDVHGGEYYIYAIYYTGRSGMGVIVAATSFTLINGSITLDPEKGPVGKQIKISGDGLRASQRITVKYDETIVKGVSGDNSTDSKGQFYSTIGIPESMAGVHIISVTDESGNHPEAEFKVEPQIVIEPPLVAAGSIVKVKGTGFTAGNKIIILLDGRQISTKPASLLVNSRGSFEAQFSVPATAEDGSLVVTATDNLFSTAEAPLTIPKVIPPPPALANINISPETTQASPGHVGMQLNITGANFKANAPVTITYSDIKPITLATINTNSAGGFSSSFNVPPSQAGSHNITATDATNTTSVAFVMESKAPPAPMLLFPQTGSAVLPEVFFDWSEVADPSGVVYVLQIASDPNFANLVLEKKELKQSEYILTGDEKLTRTNKETSYYWRVKAIDGASNEGVWTLPGTFHVGSPQLSMPGWVIYTLIGLGILVTGLCGLLLRQIWKHYH